MWMYAGVVRRWIRAGVCAPMDVRIRVHASHMYAGAELVCGCGEAELVCVGGGVGACGCRAGPG